MHDGDVDRLLSYRMYLLDEVGRLGIPLPRIRGKDAEDEWGIVEEAVFLASHGHSYEHLLASEYIARRGCAA